MGWSKYLRAGFFGRYRCNACQGKCWLKVSKVVEWSEYAFVGGGAALNIYLASLADPLLGRRYAVVLGIAAMGLWVLINADLNMWINERVGWLQKKR